MSKRRKCLTFTSYPGAHWPVHPFPGLFLTFIHILILLQDLLFLPKKIPAVWCSSVIINLTAIMLQLRYRPRILPWPQSLKQLPTPRSHIYDFHSTRLKNKTKQNKTVFVAFPIRALAASLTEVLVWFITLFQELRRRKAPVLVQSGSPLQVLFNFQQSYEK